MKRFWLICAAGAAAVLTGCVREVESKEQKFVAGSLPLPEDAPFFVKDYYDYYKTERGYTERSLNSNQGWNVTSSLSFLNMPILQYSNEIRSAVLVIHGEKAHSCYFSRDAFADMVKDNPWADNKELLIIPGAVHTDLYDRKDIIPFDKIEEFFRAYLQ